MLQEDLLNLLKKWEVDEEYYENFEREKIKLKTLRLLTESSLQRLFPEEGPRLEFQDHLNDYRKNLTGNDVSSETLFLKELVFADTVNLEGNSTMGIKGGFGSEKSIIIPIEDDMVINSVSPSKEETSVPADSACSSLQKQQARPAEDLPTSRAKKVKTDDSEPAIIAICKANLDGALVLGYFKEHGELNDDKRNILADVCLKNYLEGDYSRPLPTHAEEKIFNDILEVFPNENKAIWVSNKEEGREKAAGRGKLLSRYYGLRRKLNKVNLIPRPSKQDKPNREICIDDAARKEAEASLLWLQDHKQPWTDVIDHWKKTTSLRYDSLIKDGTAVHVYMDQYQAFADPKGYALFDADFSILYEGSEDKLLFEWPALAAFLTKDLPSKEKDVIEESPTSDVKQVRILQTVNRPFPVVTAVKRGKYLWRPSRQESREGLVLIVKDSADINTALNKRKGKYEQYGLKLGPQAVIVMPNASEVKESYVVVNQRWYLVETPRRAIDVTFKAMHCLDTPYHAECRREWMFLQLGVYDVKTAHDKKSLDIKTSAVIDDYKKFKSTP